jgi:type III restriction enzyme
LTNANHDAEPELVCLALKLAAGAGKTTVMAMLIAWQTINAVRYKSSKRFSRGFLIVAPGLTIKDGLRVLHPNNPDSSYASRAAAGPRRADRTARAHLNRITSVVPPAAMPLSELSSGDDAEWTSFLGSWYGNRLYLS